MGLNQTSVLNQKSVVVGSAAVQYTTDNFSSFTGIGAADAIVLTETITPLDGEPDNAEKPRRADGIASQEVTTTFNMWESDPVKLAALRGGIDVVVQTAGTPVVGASQAMASGAWEYDVPFQLQGQNASGLAPSITSITGSVDGVILENTDFFLQKDASTKKWSVVIIDSVTVTTEAQIMTVIYDYTPASKTEVSTGGIVAAGRVGIRLTNRTVDSADSVVAAELSIAEGTNYWYVTEYDVFYCIVNVGETFTAKNKDDTNPTVVTPMSLLGESDPTRVDGKNLYTKRTYNQVIS
jgi:hypothetical protein